MQATVDGNGEAVVVGGADKLILILFRRGGIDDQFALVRTIVGIQQLETLDGNAKVERKGTKKSLYKGLVEENIPFLFVRNRIAK